MYSRNAEPIDTRGEERANIHTQFNIIELINLSKWADNTSTFSSFIFSSQEREREEKKEKKEKRREEKKSHIFPSSFLPCNRYFLLHWILVTAHYPQIGRICLQCHYFQEALGVLSVTVALVNKGGNEAPGGYSQPINGRNIQCTLRFCFAFAVNDNTGNSGLGIREGVVCSRTGIIIIIFLSPALFMILTLPQSRCRILSLRHHHDLWLFTHPIILFLFSHFTSCDSPHKFTFLYITVWNIEIEKLAYFTLPSWFPISKLPTRGCFDFQKILVCSSWHEIIVTRFFYCWDYSFTINYKEVN